MRVSRIKKPLLLTIESDRKRVTIKFENISHHYGSIASVTDISFEVGEGEVVSLLGPSGCGKTTLLRLAAGFETPDSGQIMQDNNVLSATSGVLPPEQRQMGLVFQSYALFPHMTILKNVMFGLHSSSKADVEYANSLLADMDLSDCAEKYPHELSGGQQQRVALARALAPSPKLILLDEPYSGLDSRLRERVRDQMLHALRLSGTAALMVTHDAEEAMFMSDRIIVLREGHMIQQGRPIDLYCRPKSAFVAEFFGEVNRVPAIGQNGEVSSLFGTLPCDNVAEGEDAVIVIRHEGLQVSMDRTGGKAEGGEELHLHARIPGLNSFAEGARVHISIDPSQAFVFPDGKNI
jgi:iron(III) transport system ATP-binding protein